VQPLLLSERVSKVRAEPKTFGTARPVTSLGHQEERRVCWEWLKLFKLCPILSNYVQHIFPGRGKNFLGVVSPPLVTVPGTEELEQNCCVTTSVPLDWQTQHFIRTASCEAYLYPLPFLYFFQMFPKVRVRF